MNKPKLDRRRFLGLVATAAASAAFPWQEAQAADSGLKLGNREVFSWKGLIEEAKRISGLPYQASL